MILLILLTFAQAEIGVALNDDHSFNHPTCLMRFSDNSEYTDLIRPKLTQKGFKLDDYLPDNKLNPDDLYFTLMIEHVGGLYKDCKLTYSIAEAGGNRPSKQDKVLLTSTTKRAFPRVTFKGHERCKRGLDDLFVDIPKCRSGGLLKTKN